MWTFTRKIKEAISLLALSLLIGIAVNSFRAEGLPLFPAGSEVPSAPQSIQAVSSVEAEKLVRAGSVAVIDLRDQGLYEKSHFTDAVNMPIERIYSMTAVIQEKISRERGILLYGKGVESKSVSDFAAVLQMMGYRDIYTVTEESSADGG